MTATMLSAVSTGTTKSLSIDRVDTPMEDFKTNRLYTIDDLIVDRATTSPDTPVLGYPASARGRADYVYYSNSDLDRFADEAARNLISSGLHSNTSDAGESVVAILAPSNLDYVVSVLALSRLGHTVLFLSNRLATEAYVSLLQKTNCHYILGSPVMSKSITAIQGEYGVHCLPVVERHAYDLPSPSGPRYSRQADGLEASKRNAFIIHSSGSTGFPKPIFQTHSACLSNYSVSPGYRAFLTLPLYHNHGLSNFFRAIYSGIPIALVNASLPLSGTNLIEAMESVEPESFLGVPYALKLLGETERGISALRKCKLVMFGGSSCPDELGDRLVKEGIYLVGHYGATEMGQLMLSSRSPEDKAWNYLRPLPAIAKFLYFEPQGPDTYECVVLDGLPSKVVSNSSNPPNSFRTSDLFSPHPTIPNAWKYLGRSDDRVTLVNGEKVLPLPFEHQIRQNEFIREALVFGIGKSIPGILIIPSEKASALSECELCERVWHSVESANRRVEGFSQVSREMVKILPVGTDYPCTDKGTLIRAASYKKFADVIESVYERFENGAEDRKGQKLVMGIVELESYLLQAFKTKLGFDELTSTTDFFDAGVDSLQAITLWGSLKREVDLGSATLGQNVVFEYPNVKSLAEHLHALRTGIEIHQNDELEVMAELVQKYSSFAGHSPGPDRVDGQVVLLTGATGSLGAHVLAQLLPQDNVKKIYCLVRASSPSKAHDRVFSTLTAKKLDSLPIPNKVVCLPADLSRDDLGLDTAVINQLKTTLTTLIHSAWAVNFNLGVRSFEQQHIKGAYNLINLCLSTSTSQPAQFYFCSSISAAAGTPLPAVIAEAHVPELAHAQNMGYARSKLVTERIVKAAAEQTGMVATVLRVGQIIGDSEQGIWNTTEAIPLMIQSAVTMGALPALDETPSWLPVDIVARVILELSGVTNSTDGVSQASYDPSLVYHVQNPKLFHWTHDLLPALRDAGLSFETVSQREWVDRLRRSEPDPNKNPTVKLLDFYSNKYDNDEIGRKGLTFVTKKTASVSPTLSGGYDVVGSGIVDKLVRQWRTQW